MAIFFFSLTPVRAAEGTPLVFFVNAVTCNATDNERLYVNEQPTNGQLPLICEVRKPAAVGLDVVAAFGDDDEAAIKAAIAWAWVNRRVKLMSQRSAAELLGMKTSHLCNVLQGKKYLPLHKLTHYEWLVGNTAVTQTLERFKVLRDQEAARQVSQLFAEHLVPIHASGGGRS